MKRTAMLLAAPLAAMVTACRSAQGTDVMSVGSCARDTTPTRREHHRVASDPAPTGRVVITLRYAMANEAVTGAVIELRDVSTPSTVTVLTPDDKRVGTYVGALTPGRYRLLGRRLLLAVFTDTLTVASGVADSVIYYPHAAQQCYGY